MSLQTLKSLPRHIWISGSTVEPLPPNPFNLIAIPYDPHSVSSDPIVGEVAPYFQCKHLVLPLQREVPVPPAPLVNTFERAAISTFLRLPPDIPAALPGKSPIMGRS